MSTGFLDAAALALPTAAEQSPPPADSTDPDVVVVDDQLSADEQRYITAAQAPNTLREYRSDLADFTIWCTDAGVDEIPAAACVSRHRTGPGCRCLVLGFPHVGRAGRPRTGRPLMFLLSAPSLLTAPTTAPPSTLVDTTLHTIRQAVLQGMWNLFNSSPWPTVGVIVLMALLVAQVVHKVV